MNQKPNYPNQVRRAGFGKGLFATLFIVAAGVAYLENSKQHHVIHDDPYNRTKRSVSESADKLSEHKDTRGAVDELQKAGQHVKQSAHLAGQAVQDSFDQTKKEGSRLVDQLKNDTHQIKKDAKQNTQEAYDHLERKGSSLKRDAQDAYDNLERKGSNLKKDAQEAYDQFKREGSNTKEALSQAVKDTKDATESKIDHFRSEHHLKQGTRTAEDVVAHTHGTTTTDNNGNYVFDRASTAHGNPMVYEKLNTDRTKPGWERRMEHYAEKNVRDTSTLVGKDTEKVRGVWEDKAVRDRGRTPQHQEAKDSFWSHLFGQAAEKAQHAEEKLENEWHDVKSKWSHDADKAKDDAYYKAKNAKDDLANKAENAKDDIYYKAKGTKNDLANKAENAKNDLYKKAEDAKDNVSDSIKSKATRLKNDIYDKTDSVKSDISNKAQNVKDAVNDKAQDVKEAVSNKTQEAKDKAQGLYDGSINDLHKEVTANANKWKNQSEQTAKSWYEKGTNQVKSDLEWAEQKMQDAKDRIFNVKTGRYESSGMKGHIYRGEKMAEEEMDNLRGTRSHVKLTPAKVIVENAHGKDM